VKLYLNSLLYYKVHVTCFLMQDGGAAKIDDISCLKYVLCQSVDVRDI
jgi:hypothetical protein